MEIKSTQIFHKARQRMEIDLQKELPNDKLWNEIFSLIEDIREKTNEIEIKIKRA